MNPPLRIDCFSEPIFPPRVIRILFVLALFATAGMVILQELKSKKAWET